MNVKIVPIRVGICNCYLIIQNRSCILVDTGVAGNIKKIISAITSRGLELSDLKLIFLTHSHYDHAGNAKELKELTGARLIVHESEAKYLRKGYHPIPKGTSAITKLLVWIGKLNERPRAAFNSICPDIVYSNKLDLNEFGFEAQIIHTPGHTKGSSTLVIDNNSFAGDSIFNIAGRIYPPFANDTEQLLFSWKLLLSYKSKFYYPAHGKRITYDQLLKELERKQ